MPRLGLAVGQANGIVVKSVEISTVVHEFYGENRHIKISAKFMHSGEVMLVIF